MFVSQFLLDSAPYLTGHHSKLGLKESEENRWNTGSMNIQKNVDSNCESMIKAIRKLPAIWNQNIALLNDQNQFWKST